MELDELKQTWTEHARKLDQLLSLNLQGLKAAQLDKTRSALGRFKAFRIFEIIIGILILLPLGSYIASHISVPTLAVPALVIAASLLVPVVANVRQLILLGRISYADPITTIQRQLEEIKLHFLRSFWLPVLMLPLYLAYVAVGLNLVFGMDLFAQSSAAYLWTNLALSLVLVAPAIWILCSLSFKNLDNPVIRALVHGSGGKQIVSAFEFLKAVHAFEKDENGTATQTIVR